MLISNAAVIFRPTLGGLIITERKAENPLLPGCMNRNAFVLSVLALFFTGD